MSCPDCFSGTLHVGSPTGTVTRLHGLPVYEAKPRDGGVPNGTIVMIPDAFGWDFVNNRLLCDQYAEKGFLVYLPDFMGGRSAPIGFLDLMEKKIRSPASWFTTIFVKPFYILKVIYMVIPWLYFNRKSVCRPRIFEFFKQVRTSPPETKSRKLGAAGFCWGGYYAFQLAHDLPSTRIQDKPLIDCAYAAHPSMLKLPTDIEAVRKTIPLSVVVGDEDRAMKMPAINQMKDIFEGQGKRKGAIGDQGEEDERDGPKVHEVTVLKGAKHGFAIRLNPEDEVQSQCAEEAERLAVGWFGRWLV